MSTQESGGPGIDPDTAAKTNRRQAADQVSGYRSRVVAVSNLDYALAYAAAGLPVLPLSGKVPLTAHGKDDAAIDIDVIASWWTRWPHANIGVRPLPGLVVLDVDPRNGGADSLAELQQRHGILPATLTAETGSGGWHIWLSYLGPSRGKLATGIDVKTNSGYLVAPPSVHPCGGTYRWIDPSPTAPAPAWVRRLLNPPRPTVHTRPPSGSGGIDALVRFVLAAEDGNLNNRLYWAACRARESGLDTAPLVVVAVEKGHPPRGAQNTVDSAGTAPTRSGVQS